MNKLAECPLCGAIEEPRTTEELIAEKPFGPHVHALFQEMLKRAQAINHSTCWIENTAERNSHQTRILLFFTCNEATAIKAREALAAAGVLCETDLGYFDPSASA